MTSNNDLCSLLSDLKEYGLLGKYPDLERAVKLGYQQLPANPKSHTAIYKTQAQDFELARQGLESLKDSAEEKPKLATRQIKSPEQMIDKEMLMEGLRQFKG